MADLEEEHSKSTKKNSSSFINHVFNFDDDSKSEMSNIMQYGILSVIPIVLLNKQLLIHVYIYIDGRNRIGKQKA